MNTFIDVFKTETFQLFKDLKVNRPTHIKSYSQNSSRL